VEEERRLAAVDIGSNTVHVLVADAVHGGLRDVAFYVEMPELALRLHRLGELGPDGRRDALEALDTVLGQARAHGYRELVAGATAAVRQAPDGVDLLREASEHIGVPVRLISERREAQLAFLGVASRHASEQEWVMADVGGGSTEVVAARGIAALAWASLPVGSGGFAARFLSDPPTLTERAALRSAAASVLEEAPRTRCRALVVTGGTASTLPLAVSVEHPPERLRRVDLTAAIARLDAGPAATVAAALGLPEARVRALRSGAEILGCLLDLCGRGELEVSHEGLRHGMLLSYLADGDAWPEESESLGV
jgi:exopolyphosphatase / guanosine-5'-triphosphate,3'-diphosphate pyrophosphatase